MYSEVIFSNKLPAFAAMGCLCEIAYVKCYDSWVGLASDSRPEGSRFESPPLKAVTFGVMYLSCKVHTLITNRMRTSSRDIRSKMWNGSPVGLMETTWTPPKMLRGQPINTLWKKSAKEKSHQPPGLHVSSIKQYGEHLWQCYDCRWRTLLLARDLAMCQCHL